MYYLIYKDIEIGGIETLILREVKWLQKKTSTECCVMCNSISDQMKSSFELNNIKYIVLKNWKPSEINNVLQNDNNVILIKYFSFLDYLDFVISSYCKQKKCVYYCVHPHHSFIFKNNSGYRKKAKSAVSALVRCMLTDNKIRFMDEETLFSTLDYYDIPMNENYKKSIDRLPYEIKDIVPKKRNSSQFSVLTVSRAEFPFKGYMLGLIDEMKGIVQEFPNVYLTVISGGRDVEILKNKVNYLDNDTQKHIVFLDSMPPEDLEKYYSYADLFIGMGTTVLDAANYSLPSVIAKPDTTEMFTNGYFHTNPKDIGLFTNKNISATEYIKNIIRMSEKEYADIQKKTKEALCEYYDADKIISNNLSIEIENIENDYVDIDFGSIKFFMFLKMLKNKFKKGD